MHPVSYLLGELPLENGKLLWTSYFADIAEDESNPPDETLKEKYNGIAVRTGEDSYHLKVNIYGYDDEMIADLKPYLLEGTIDADEMKEKNLVILKTLVDGQGNYDGIDILAGDEIQLKTVKNLSVPEEALKFLGEEEWYQILFFVKSYKIPIFALRYIFCLVSRFRPLSYGQHTCP